MSMPTDYASTSRTKQRRVFESVRHRIETGDFRPGDRIPSDSELVREFGVSRPTVAKALRELEECGLVKRRAGSGTYVLDMVQGRQLFGLLIPGLGQTEIFEPICAEMARVAQESGHLIVWGASSPDLNDQDLGRLAEDLCQQYIRDQVGGVFFAPLEHVADKDAVNRRVIASLSQAKIPVVLLDRDFVPYPERSDYDLVGVDNRRVGYTITHHLLKQGCERVVFFARPGSAATIDARIAGFMEAVVKDTGKFDSPLVIRESPTDEAAVRRFVEALRPDGIVCGNDVTAGCLMHSLDKLGIKVPEEVCVAGIDDVKYAAILRVPLTTMRQPCVALGDTAFRAMLERLEYPEAPARDILLGCDLIVRESCKKAASPEIS